MKLNVDNRVKFKNIILTDVLQKRSDDVRTGMTKLSADFRDRTFGKTSQARAAVKKRIAKIKKDAKAISDLGIASSIEPGVNVNDIALNLAGQRIDLKFWDAPLTEHTINFEQEYLTYTRFDNYEGRETHRMGSSSLTLVQGEPMIQRFWDLKKEAQAIADASEELTAVLDTVFGKSKTLGAALDKWPQLSQYVPAIMSSSKEIVVPVETLNKRLDVLRSGKGKVADAMKVEA